jgi:hypothetical protein
VPHFSGYTTATAIGMVTVTVRACLETSFLTSIRVGGGVAQTSEATKLDRPAREVVLRVQKATGRVRVACPRREWSGCAACCDNRRRETNFTHHASSHNSPGPWCSLHRDPWRDRREMSKARSKSLPCSHLSTLVPSMTCYSLACAPLVGYLDSTAERSCSSKGGSDREISGVCGETTVERNEWALLLHSPIVDEADATHTSIAVMRESFIVCGVVVRSLLLWDTK